MESFLCLCLILHFAFCILHFYRLLPALMAHGYVAIVSAQQDLVALGDPLHIPVETGVDDGLGAAGADGLDLRHRVGHLEQAAAALKEVAEEVGAQTEAEDGNVVDVDDGAQSVHLGGGEELALVCDDHVGVGVIRLVAGQKVGVPSDGVALGLQTDAGADDGGTVTGVGEYLKEQKASIKVIAVEPDDSPVLSEGRAGAHKIQGIGAGFIPDTLNTSVYDEVYRATGEESFAAGKLLARTEGISVGISSGAALSAAIAEAKKPEDVGKVIVALLPDSGDRYYSTPLFTEA